MTEAHTDETTLPLEPGDLNAVVLPYEEDGIEYVDPLKAGE